jgi:L-malate glycosyltransferase
MRVALIIPSLKKFGPIVFTDYLVKSLLDKVDYVEVFYLSSHSPGEHVVDFNCKVTKLSFFTKYDFSDFDIIHSTMLLPDLYVVIHKLYKNHSCVSSMHNYIDVDLKMLYSFLKYIAMTKLWYFSLKHFENIIVSSESMLEYYSKRLPMASNIKVINYGIPSPCISDGSVSECDLLSRLKEKYTILGTCGLLIKRKGFHQLVELLRINSEIAIIVIGSGPELQYLTNLALKANVSDRFILLGFKLNYLDYYKYFDVFVMSSYSEGFGIAMLEALSLCKPLVCSRLGIYESIFSPSDVGFFEPDDIESLAYAVDCVIKDLNRYSNSSFDIFSRNFTLDAMGRNHLAFYCSSI